MLKMTSEKTMVGCVEVFSMRGLEYRRDARYITPGNIAEVYNLVCRGNVEWLYTYQRINAGLASLDGGLTWYRSADSQ